MKNYPSNMQVVYLACLALLFLPHRAHGLEPPSTIADLHLVEGVQVSFETYRGGSNYTAHLLTYTLGDLTLRALVATPKREPPRAGYPILVANHGFHPDPPKYGITARGENWRPGDYYRSIPEAFTERGFLVVMADYRGHNDSTGGAYARGFLASSYYTQDVVALMHLLPNLPLGDDSHVFMWGHSMGGEVTLRALLAPLQLRAASIWSSVGGDIWQQAYAYGLGDPLLTDEPHERDRIQELREDFERLDEPLDWRAIEPTLHLERLNIPLNIHHAIGDRGALYAWSMQLATRLTVLDKPHTFLTYPGSDHFFEGEQFTRAIDRDVAFFRSFMKD